MKVALLGEGPSDVEPLRILVAAILKVEVVAVEPDVRVPGPRGSGGVAPLMRAVVPFYGLLSEQPDVDGLVAVVDTDDDDVPGPGAPVSGRLLKLRDKVAQARSARQASGHEPTLPTAVGVAVPAVEAWYLCGEHDLASEEAFRAGRWAQRGVALRNELKRLVYGTSQPSVEVAAAAAIAQAKRLAADLRTWTTEA